MTIIDETIVPILFLRFLSAFFIAKHYDISIGWPTYSCFRFTLFFLLFNSLSKNVLCVFIVLSQCLQKFSNIYHIAKRKQNDSILKQQQPILLYDTSHELTNGLLDANKKCDSFKQ